MTRQRAKNIFTNLKDRLNDNDYKGAEMYKAISLCIKLNKIVNRTKYLSLKL